MSSHTPRILVATAVLAAGLSAAAGARAEGLYVGGALARPDWNGGVNATGGGGSSGVGLKLYGGWGFTPNFALEGGYVDLGHNKDDANGNRARANGVYVDAVGLLPVAPGWTLLGSAGVAQARFKTAAGNDSSAGLKLGLGVKYALDKNTDLRVGYDHYRFNSAFDDKARLGQYNIGVDFRF